MLLFDRYVGGCFTWYQGAEFMRSYWALAATAQRNRVTGHRVGFEFGVHL